VNKQGKLVNGKVIGGIEWTKTVLPDGTERQGFTNNAIPGCEHDCEWEMPDGTRIVCYAKTTAERGAAKAAYPHGFAHPYPFNEATLRKPLGHKTPARIFVDSMGDLFGAWVTWADIAKCFALYREAHWHTFLSLTKNPARLRAIPAALLPLPPNLHVGFSSPADWMRGHVLTPAQKERWTHAALNVWDTLPAAVRWMSIEPLAWDIAPVLAEHRPLDWAVIGAASDGAKKHQPDPRHLENLLTVLDAQRVPVFFKGNLKASPHREFLPGFTPTAWNEAEHLESQ
jgi:protein gp37